jgi:hypothetical protein
MIVECFPKTKTKSHKELQLNFTVVLRSQKQIIVIV